MCNGMPSAVDLREEQRDREEKKGQVGQDRKRFNLFPFPLAIVLARLSLKGQTRGKMEWIGKYCDWSASVPSRNFIISMVYLSQKKKNTIQSKDFVFLLKS